MANSTALTTLAALLILALTGCDPVVRLDGQVTVEPAAFTVDDGPVQLTVTPGAGAGLEPIPVTVLCAPPAEVLVFDYEGSDIACVEETTAVAELRAVTLAEDCGSLSDDELKRVRVTRVGEVVAVSADAVVFEGRTTDRCNKDAEDTQDFLIE